MGQHTFISEILLLASLLGIGVAGVLRVTAGEVLEGIHCC